VRKENFTDKRSSFQCELFYSTDWRLKMGLLLYSPDKGNLANLWPKIGQSLDCEGLCDWHS